MTKRIFDARWSTTALSAAEGEKPRRIKIRIPDSTVLALKLTLEGIGRIKEVAGGVTRPQAPPYQEIPRAQWTQAQLAQYLWDRRREIADSTSSVPILTSDAPLEAESPNSADQAIALSLPEDHPVHKLSEARKHYLGRRRPPFVQEARKTRPGARKPVVLADSNGLLKAGAARADLICHAWERTTTFWTLDLRGKRWIVKAFGGAPQGGVRYLSWLGPKKTEDFLELPVAFSKKQTSTAPAEEAENDGISGDKIAAFDNPNCIPTDLDGHIDCDICGAPVPDNQVYLSCGICDPHCTGRKLGNFDLCQRCFNQGSRCLEDSHNLIKRTVRDGRVFKVTPPVHNRAIVLDGQDERTSDIDADVEVSILAQRLLERSEPDRSENGHSGDKRRRSLRPEQQHPSKKRLRPTRNSELPPRIPSSSWLETTPDPGEQAHTSGAVPDTASSPLFLSKGEPSQQREARHDSLYSATPRPPQRADNLLPPSNSGLDEPRIEDSTNPLKPTAGPRAATAATAATEPDHPRQRSFTKAILQAVAIPNVRESEGSAPHSKPTPSAPAPVAQLIDDYKTSHTTLHISLSTNDYGAVPVYLSSCLSDTFFQTILNAWGLDSEKDDVAAVTVSFDWLSQGSFVLRQGIKDSWLKVLEVVDDAPVWENGKGKCDVRVRIIIKGSAAANAWRLENSANR